MEFARTSAVAGASGWIGAQPSRSQLAATLLVGTVGMLICGVQPVLLGSLLLERRLSSTALGWATTAEFLALALGVWLAGTFWSPTRIRVRVAIAAVLAILADCLVLRGQGTAVLVNRALAGLFEGILVWLTACMIARCPAPARMAAVFLTLQNVSQFAFAAILPATLIRHYGANGGFVALAATAALALAATPFIPDSFVPLPSAAGHTGRVVYSASGVACLASIFLIGAFSIGLFAYIAPLGAQAHLGEEAIGYAVSAVLCGSTLGSLLAAAWPRIPPYPVFVVCLLINTGVVLLLTSLPAPVPFFCAAALFGFFWLFFLPFQVPMAIEADPTRQVSVVLPAAQLFGAGSGPLLASFFVTDTDARGAVVACWICFAIAFAIATTQHVRRRKTNRRQPQGAAA